MKWFDNMIVRALNRVAARSKTEGGTQPSRQYLHNSHLSDILNGRVCSMVYSIDNGFILVDQNPMTNSSAFVYAKDAVEVGEAIARHLTLQRMGVLQGSSIKAAQMASQMAAQQAKSTVTISNSNYSNPSF